MSYAFTDRARWLYGAHALRGLGAGASASINVGSGIKPGDIKPSDVADAAGVQLPDCSSAAITGNSYIDSTFVKCCEDIKKMSGMSTKDKAKGIGQCATRGAATGGCVAAGVFTFGITTALAPLCGTIAAAVFDRVMGWDKGQWVAASAAGVLCGAVSGGSAGPICAFAAAELIGWISDTLGPVFDGIFNPSAAKDRELAARASFHALTAAREDLLLQADAAIRQLWSNSIKSIKDVYQSSVGLLPASYQAKAQQILGFAPSYAGIAAALVAAGVPATPMSWPTDGNGHTVADRLHTQRANNGGYGCESTADGCLKDGYSEVCPFSFSDLYMTLYYSQGIDKLTGNTRDRQVAFEQQALTTMQTLASAMLPAMQQSIAVVSTKVATVVIGLKQQALIDEATAMATAKNVAKFLSTALQAAKASEDAAGKAKSWSSSTRKSAIATAQSKYEIVKQARAVLTVMAPPGTAPLSAANQKKLSDAMSRAIAAVKAAQSNAHTAELMIGGAAVAGVVGIGYLVFGEKMMIGAVNILSNPKTSSQASALLTPYAPSTEPALASKATPAWVPWAVGAALGGGILYLLLRD